jgi:transposase
MFIRTTQRKNKDGETVRYLQIAHNVRDPETGVPRAQIIHNLGREDQLDREALARLVRSMSRFLDPDAALSAQAPEGMRMMSSRSLGGAFLLDSLWRRLGIGKTLEGLLSPRRYSTECERAIFAMVANRALAPYSKLSACSWALSETVIEGLDRMDVQHAYRAMDFLLSSEEDIQREVFFSAANLLNLEVDLLFFDTTSVYFQTEEEDEGEEALRKRGHSKDKRGDLPQLVVGLAVTREGIPVRCWSFPGNSMDMTLIKRIKDDLAGWKLSRIITVVDRGFSSEENLRYLQRGGGHYIAGEKMRSGKPQVEAALSRPGRFRKVKDNLEVKEITVGDGEKRVRYVLARNPQRAKRDAFERGNIVGRIEEELAHLPELKGEAHSRAACALLAHKAYGRYLKTDERGNPIIDRERIAADARLDGKFLIQTSDDTLSPEDVALGYKQLFEVEDAFKSLKHTLDIRPVYHRKEDRIRAHVLVCWLALLLIRVAETEAGETWRNIRRQMGAMHLVEFTGKDGRVMQRTETTPAQASIFRSLSLKEPPRFFQVAAK